MLHVLDNICLVIPLPLSTTINHHKLLPFREQQSKDQSFETDI